MKRSSIAIILFCIAITVSSCGGGGSSGTAGGESLQSRDMSIEGHIQKGPFIQGSRITIQSLDSSLNPTGSMYITYTTDDSGTFSVPITVTSDYIEIIAEGAYFNEVSGRLSDAPLYLKTIALLDRTATSQKLNVNILTTLAYDRAKYLFLNNKLSLADAKAQATIEVLRLFGIDLPSLGEGSISLEAMDLSSSTTADAILIAVSAIMQADNSVAQLEEMAAKISDDVKSDGTLDNQTYRDAIVNNSARLDLKAINSNLKARYAGLGKTLDIPPFETYVDNDRSGYIDLLETDPVSFSLTGGEFNTAIAVELTTSTPEATIHYTLDNSDPTETSPVYSGPIGISGDGTSVVIKAKAFCKGLIPSRIVSNNYIINYLKASEPLLSYMAGIYNSDFVLKFSGIPENTIIYYTLDGSTPTNKSQVYTNGGIPIKGDGKEYFVKAFSIQDGKKDSDVAASLYRIDYAYAYPYQTAALDMAGYSNAILGTWIGYITTPWTTPYNVQLTFNADGSCTGTTLSSASFDAGKDYFRPSPFYYGDTTVYYRLDDINTAGKASGVFRVFSTSNGVLQNLSFDKNLEVMEFEYWHRDYGPMTYRLIRMKQ